VSDPGYRRGVSVQMTDQIAARAVRPRLRGVLHQAAFVIAVGLAPLLIVGADSGRRRLAAAVFAGSVARGVHLFDLPANRSDSARG
jgi:hypothetical protein